jgi:hypothetical protein
MKPITVYLHFNKQGAPKGFPWTIHTSKACLPASRVVLEVPIETVWKPTKKQNPRAFLRAKGFVRHLPGGLIVISPTQQGLARKAASI